MIISPMMDATRRLVDPLIILGLLLAACGGEGSSGRPDGAIDALEVDAPRDADATEIPTPTAYTYTVVATYPHDSDAYTQGLVYDDGALLEGTGRFGHSTLRRVTLETGVVEQQIDLDPRVFGEGIAVIDDAIVQLTWQSGIGYVWDAETLTPRTTFAYPTEGWGLTTDGDRLIMGDGTSRLYTLDPESFAQSPLVDVRDEHGPVERLNELEMVDGHVYANVWQTDLIVIIDPETGHVTGRIDLTGLLDPGPGDPDALLNGIAYDATERRLFVTGKLWPALFEIDVVPLAE